MNLSEIIEALNCCSGNVDNRDCEACPYFNERRCLDKLLEHSMTVIQRYERNANAHLQGYDVLLPQTFSNGWFAVLLFYYLCCWLICREVTLMKTLEGCKGCDHLSTPVEQRECWRCEKGDRNTSKSGVSMATILKPCPFCGGKGETITKPMRVGEAKLKTFYRIRCEDCYAQSPYKRNAYLHGYHKTLADAVDAWNRRTKDENA